MDVYRASGKLIVLLAAACGIIAANIYYAQPLVGLMGADLGLPPAAAGLLVTLTQIGYGLGLLFIVPLGDLIENRKLVLTIMMLGVVALGCASMARGADLFLLASLFIGLGSVSVQVLVPYAAHLAPQALRGQVVGKVMSGLLLGIMLARPAASFVTSLLGWRAVFWLSALLVALLALMLRLALPVRRPSAKTSYGELLGSLWRLWLDTPVLRRRAAYHVGMFGAFSLFWTTVPQWLAGPVFRFSQLQVALFALLGVAGVIAAPIAGRLADRELGRTATCGAMLVALVAFVLMHVGAPGSALGLCMLMLAALLLDMGVSANLVLGQREIYLLDAALRSRLNGLYMSLFFAGGAVGSALGGWAYAKGGWSLAAWIGAALPLTSLLYWFVAEPRGGSRQMV